LIVFRDDFNYVIIIYNYIVMSTGSVFVCVTQLDKDSF